MRWLRKKIRKLLKPSLILALSLSCNPTFGQIVDPDGLHKDIKWPEGMTEVGPPVGAKISDNLKPGAPFMTLDRDGVDKINECFRDKKDCEAALKKASSSDVLGTIVKVGGGVLVGLVIGKVVFSGN